MNDMVMGLVVFHCLHVSHSFGVLPTYKVLEFEDFFFEFVYFWYTVAIELNWLEFHANHFSECFIGFKSKCSENFYIYKNILVKYGW